LIVLIDELTHIIFELKDYFRNIKNEIKWQKSETLRLSHT
jgi:hypothetical protein